MAAVVTLIRGDDPADGFAGQLREVLEVAGAALEWCEFSASAAALDEGGEFMDSARSTGCVLEAWAPPEAVKAAMLPAPSYLAPALGLDVCVRPLKSISGVGGARPDVDLLLFHGTTEGPHAGLELRSRQPETERLAAEISTASGVAAGAALGSEPGLSVLSCTRHGSERVVETALEFARTHARHKLLVAHQAPALPATDGLFLHTARNVAVRFPEVQFEDRPLGEALRELAGEPAAFDVVVTPPLYGALLAGLCEGLVGGPGLAPELHLGADGAALFAAAWPSGRSGGSPFQGGPWGVLLASVWMLRHLAESAAAGRLEEAVAAAIAEGAVSATWTDATAAVRAALGA